MHWGDCDPANIVFYPNYFKWFDQGTWDLFASVGFNMATFFEDEGILGTPILDAHAKFLAPSRRRDVITVESTIESWGNTSFKVAHTIYNGDREAVKGHEVRGWVVVDPESPKGLRAIPVPGRIKDRFA